MQATAQPSSLQTKDSAAQTARSSGLYFVLPCKYVSVVVFCLDRISYLEPRFRTFPPQELSNTLWAFAMLALQPARPVALAARARALLPRMDAQEVPQFQAAVWFFLVWL